MKEIEVKAQLKNRNQLIERLASFGCALSSPITQKDRIFIPAGSVFPPVEPGVNVLRIREQDGAYIFTLKLPMKNQLDCIERESGIDNPDEMVEIFKLLGFQEVSHVRKIRQKTKYQNLEICLDSVEELGDFVEVEKMTDASEDAERVQSELFEFLETLGIEKEDQIFDGYDVLMIKRATETYYRARGCLFS